MNLSEEQPQLPPVQNQAQNDDNQAAPPVQVQAQPTSTSAQQPADPALPAAAGDEDLIEKEWVDKAKEIVDNTVGDPHAQSNQLGKMKSDYIRKRYGKDIKT